jgi:hypothetical protein
MKVYRDEQAKHYTFYTWEIDASKIFNLNNE